MRAKHINPDEEFTAYDFSHLSARKIALNQMFAIEMLKDFNPTLAVMRMGLADTREKAKDKGKSLMDEPHVQYTIRKFIDEAKDEAFITRSQVIYGLIQEANCYRDDANGASRTAAWRGLAKIKGMESSKLEIDTPISGVMLVPVLAGDATSWGEQAAKTQAELKKSAAA